MAQAKYVDEKTFKENLSANVGEPTDAVLRKQFACDEVKSIDESKRLIDFVISTASVDRMGDTIDVDGWDLKAYKKNPVILFAHDNREPPIAKAIRVSKAGGKLTARAEFTPHEMNPFGFSIFQMYLGGFMKATSVGFRPLELEMSDDDDRPWGVNFIRQELLEFSAVPVPANPEALIEARAAGIDTMPMKVWAERILDEWDEHGSLMVPKRAVIALRKHADKKGIKTHVPVDVQDKLLLKNLSKIKKDQAMEKENKDKLDAESIAKAPRMTGMTNGHQHAYDDAEEGMTMEADGHMHPMSIMASPEGQRVTINEASGHTHAPDPANADEGPLPGPHADADVEVEKDQDDIEKPDVETPEKDFDEDLPDDLLEELYVDDEKDYVKILSGMLEDSDIVLDALSGDTFKAVLETRQGKRLLSNVVSSLREVARSVDRLIKADDPDQGKELEDEVTPPEKAASDDEVNKDVLFFLEPEEEKIEKDVDTTVGFTVEDVKAALKEVLPQVIAEQTAEQLKAVTGKVD